MLKPKDILDFWFGSLDEEGMPPKEKRELWFQSNRQHDQLMRRRFLSYVMLASELGLPDWEDTAEGKLALILLLDQFSRNIYRGLPLAFSNDRQARNLCRQGLEKGMDVKLPIIQRAFFYMPLQHSENIADQEESVALFEQLFAMSHGAMKDVIGGFLRFAREHYEIVREFGRFPHRNAVLKRVSTPAEKDFLLKDARTYGQ